MMFLFSWDVFLHMLGAPHWEKLALNSISRVDSSFHGDFWGININSSYSWFVFSLVGSIFALWDQLTKILRLVLFVFFLCWVSWVPNEKKLRKNLWKKMARKDVYFGLSPLPVRVTTRIITFLVGNPYKPSFPLLLGGGTTQCILYSLLKKHFSGFIVFFGGGWSWHPPWVHDTPWTFFNRRAKVSKVKGWRLTVDPVTK